MTTIAAGASDSVTLAQGSTLKTKGAGIATLGPGPQANQQIGLLGSNTLGPFQWDQVIYISASAQVDYTVAVNQDGVPAARLATDASGAVTGLVGPDGKAISLGGGSGLPTVSAMVSVSATTAAPATSGAYVAFGAQACTELHITNRTGVEVEYVRNGGTNFMSIRPGVTRRIVGITDASQIAVRRSDWADAAVTTGTNTIANRTSTVTAMAVTSTESFAGAAILNQSITNGGATTSLPAQACAGLELVNNSGKDIQYRTSATAQYLRLPSGASAIVLGITNANQVQIQPYDNVADAVPRTVMAEAFTSGLREPLNLNQPQPLISAHARVMAGEAMYPSKLATPPDLTIAEIARGPRRTLVPKKVYPLAQFSTVANMVGATAQSIDAADGDIFMGSSQVEFTQVASGTFNFAPASALANGIDVTNGMIRTTQCFPAPPGSPTYDTTSALTSLKIQLFSSGSPTAVPADYHEASVSSSTPGFTKGTGGTSQAKRNFSFSIPTAKFAAVGTGADLTSIKWARFQLVTGSAGNTAKFRPVAIDFVPNALSKAIVIFSVDDFHSGIWTALMPALSKYGYPGVMFADTAVKLGSTGFLTAEQVRILHQQYGWQVANQNFRNETNFPYSIEQTLQEHAKFNLYMQALGIGDVEDSSYGSSNSTNIRDDNIPALRRMYRSAPLFVNGNPTTPPFSIGETAPYGDPYRIKRLNMSSSFGTGNFLQRLKEHVDQAVATKGVAFFGAHGEFNAGSSSEVLTALPDLVDYIRSLEVAGSLEVLTLAQANDKIYPR
jgi:hypothetical protein